MKEMLLEWGICIVAACFLMILHELTKSLVYIGMQRRAGNVKKYTHSIWALHRYLDPVGVILAITSGVSFSKPFMYRIRDKKMNRVLGFTGFFVLLAAFGCSILALRFHVFGVAQMKTLEHAGLLPKIVTLWIQYMAILSFGMLVTNLFPISTFDMGLVIAGFSAQKYLSIIKMDAIIKIIFIVTLLFDLIQYGGYRLIDLLI